MKQAICTIEHHAALYGLIAKEATLCGLEGQCALAKAVSLYGRERGQRMASYAKMENMDCTMPIYSLFKEWRPQEGQMKPGEIIKSPQYITSSRRCEWVETWKKYDLLEYGKTYCLHVDENLVKGFNPDLELVLPALQSLGDPCCVFLWGYDRTPELEAELKKESDRIGDKYVRDFDFHTAHLYCTISGVLREELGQVGEDVCHRAMEQFCVWFGEEARDAIQVAAKEAGWEYGES